MTDKKPKRKPKSLVPRDEEHAKHNLRLKQNNHLKDLEKRVKKRWTNLSEEEEIILPSEAPRPITEF